MKYTYTIKLSIKIYLLTKGIFTEIAEFEFH